MSRLYVALSVMCLFAMTGCERAKSPAPQPEAASSVKPTSSPYAESKPASLQATPKQAPTPAPKLMPRPQAEPKAAESEPDPGSKSPQISAPASMPKPQKRQQEQKVQQEQKARQVDKTPQARLPLPERQCKTSSDCVALRKILRGGHACCASCDATAVTRTYRDAFAEACRARERSVCPSLGCAPESATAQCVGGTCKIVSSGDVFSPF
jgi:hypothetical protein